jgi:hypothetical protein
VEGDVGPYLRLNGFGGVPAGATFFERTRGKESRKEEIVKEKDER